MKKVFLSGKHGEKLFTLVDDDDFEKVNQYKWHLNMGYVARKPYKGKNIYLHQVILGKKEGFNPDHINGNRLDNRKSNLRFATPAQNNRNSKRKSTNKSGYKGVHYFIQKGVHKDTERWRAMIHVNDKSIHIGVFKTIKEAAKAYDKKAEEVFGEFARLNFPKEDER